MLLDVPTSAGGDVPLRGQEPRLGMRRARLGGNVRQDADLADHRCQGEDRLLRLRVMHLGFDPCGHRFRCWRSSKRLRRHVMSWR